MRIPSNGASPVEIAQVLNGGLGFGNGADIENIRGEWITYVSNAVADTEDTVAHGLGVVPIGYIVFGRDKAGVPYSGGTAWTSSNLFLKSDVAETTYLLFVVTGEPSN